MKLTMPEFKSSTLLSPEENDLVFSLLGPRCQTLATTVVELYTTGSRDSDKWYYKDIGVLCLVKDNAKRSYFFRLFCIVKKQMIWEHEIYNNMNYLAPTSFLHTFEAEDCITAFNFADEDEGVYLRNMLLEKLEAKKQRRLEKKQRHNNNYVGVRNTTATVQGPEINLHAIINKPRLTNKREGKKKLTKADIGQPHDFKHVSHVGWDPNKGFDVAKVEDPQLKEFFHKAGVSEIHLRDKDTREFIYDFIQRNGGMEAVAGALDVAPPIPTRSRAPPPPPTPRAPPSIPPPPPPPPPTRTLPPRSLPPTPKPAEQVDYPVPPPPPAPGMMPPPPPPMDNGPSFAPPADDPRSALMEAIRNGPQLKPVGSTSNEQKTASTDSRGELMNQIRQGAKLKPVNQTPATVATSEPKGLAGALARALAERSKVIYSSDSDDDDDDDEEEDDDWEVE